MGTQFEAHFSGRVSNIVVKVSLKSCWASSCRRAATVLAEGHRYVLIRHLRRKSMIPSSALPSGPTLWLLFSSLSGVVLYPRRLLVRKFRLFKAKSSSV